MRLRNPLLLLAISVSALLVWWLLGQSSMSPEAQSPSMQAQRLAYYMEDFAMRRFSAQGAPLYQLSAKRLQKSQRSDLALLQAPRIVLSHPNSPWQLHAKQGQLDIKRNRVRLLKQVSLSDGQQQLRSDELLLDLPNRHLSSEQHVSLQSANWQLTGKGLDSDLDSGRLEIHSEVKIRYDLPSS